MEYVVACMVETCTVEMCYAVAVGTGRRAMQWSEKASRTFQRPEFAGLHRENSSLTKNENTEERFVLDKAMVVPGESASLCCL